MENWIWSLIVVTTLVLGFAVGIWFVDVPVCETCDVCVPTTIEVTKIVNNTVEVEDTLLEDSVYLFIDELDDEDDLICDRDEFELDDVSVSKIYDEYSIAYDDDEMEVSFETKLKFDDDDEKCYDKYEVSVLYEEDEDPEINYSLI